MADPQSPLYSLQNVPIDSGNLILEKHLGHGAYGVVYQATSLQKRRGSSFSIPASKASAVLAIRRLQQMPAAPAPKTRYAVKAVLGSLHGRARLQHETEAHLHLRASGHRGILTLHRVVREGYFMYFVLDLCPSGDLFDAVTRGVYFHKVQDIKSIFLQLIDAVEHCHSLGIFHRDLKLENILLKNQEGDPPHIVLSDFGLATDKISARDRSGSQMYMSPECLGRYKSAIPYYDCAANDIWSMGIILVILIVGDCTPWAMASDACAIFSNYANNTRDFFARRHCMTPETNALMMRIFELNPPMRISLRDLRPAVDALKEFTSIAVDGERHDTVPKDASEEDPVAPLHNESTGSKASSSSSSSGGSGSTSPSFNPFALRSSASESFDMVPGPELSPVLTHVLLPEAQEYADIPPIHEEMGGDHNEESTEHSQLSCGSDDDVTVNSDNGLGLALGPAQTTETIVTVAKQLELDPETSPPPAYQEIAQESSPPASRGMVIFRPRCTTPSHRALAHFLLRSHDNNRRGRSPRFAGHGPSPLRQMASPDSPWSSSSASSSSVSSSSTGTASSLSDYGDEINFPITPPMGLIDDGVIEQGDKDVNTITPTAEPMLSDRYTTTKQLELRRTAIKLGLSLITAPTRQLHIRKRVPVPSIDPEVSASPSAPIPIPIPGGHPLGRWKARGRSPSAEEEEDSFRLMESAAAGDVEVEVEVEVEVRKTRWERLAGRPRIRVGAMTIGGGHKGRE